MQTKVCLLCDFKRVFCTNQQKSATQRLFRFLGWQQRIAQIANASYLQIAERTTTAFRVSGTISAKANCSLRNKTNPRLVCYQGLVLSVDRVFAETNQKAAYKRFVLFRNLQVAPPRYLQFANLFANLFRPIRRQLTKSSFCFAIYSQPPPANCTLRNKTNFFNFLHFSAILVLCHFVWLFSTILVLFQSFWLISAILFLFQLFWFISTILVLFQLFWLFFGNFGSFPSFFGSFQPFW